MNASPQALQLQALAVRIGQSDRVAAQLRKLGAVVQAKTTVDWSSQQFPYVSESGTLEHAQVGACMVANLDPDSPVQGNDAESTHQAPLYNSLKKYWNPGAKKWIRGHLLNANLGGPNVAVNLFPITGHANGDHLNFVENHVKKWILEDRKVQYQVTATRHNKDTGRTEGSVAIPDASGSFMCRAETVDSGEKKRISRLIESEPVDIRSKVGHASTKARDPTTGNDTEFEHAIITSELGEKIKLISQSDDPFSTFMDESEDLTRHDWTLLGHYSLGPTFQTDYKEDFEELNEEPTEDSETDSAGKVLNAGLKKWINHKKLGKYEAEDWLKKKRVGQGNHWHVEGK